MVIAEAYRGGRGWIRGSIQMESLKGASLEKKRSSK
jgi:hypothetical protein